MLSNIREDMLLRSAFCGAIAAIFANLTLYALNLFIPEQTVNMPQLTMEIFLDIECYAKPLGKVTGLIWSVIVGGVYALVYMMILRHTGWRHLWLKALKVVSALWLIGAGFVLKLLNLGAYVRQEPAAILAFFVAHLFFATYLSFLVHLLAPDADSPERSSLRLTQDQG